MISAEDRVCFTLIKSLHDKAGQVIGHVEYDLEAGKTGYKSIYPRDMTTLNDIMGTNDVKLPQKLSDALVVYAMMRGETGWDDE